MISSWTVKSSGRFARFLNSLLYFAGWSSAYNCPMNRSPVVPTLGTFAQSPLSACCNRLPRAFSPDAPAALPCHGSRSSCRDARPAQHDPPSLRGRESLWCSVRREQLSAPTLPAFPQRAAVCAIDVRVSHRPVVVPRHENVVLHEPHEGIAIGVCRTDRNGFHIFAIQMERDFLIVGGRGQCGCRRRSSWCTVGSGIGIGETLA